MQREDAMPVNRLQQFQINNRLHPTIIFMLNTISLSSFYRIAAAALYVFLFFGGLSYSYAQYGNNPTLPPIPSVSGPLGIRIVYPTVEMIKPNVKNNFIFGTIGTGAAALSINGKKVPVAPNGAFLGFLPVPRDGVYTLIAAKGEEQDTLVYTYAKPAERAAGTKQVRNVLETPELGVVTGGADTLATGSGIAYGAKTPTADREWFFPKGARFPVLEQRGRHLRIDLAGKTAWVEKRFVTVSSEVPKTAEAGLNLEFEEYDRWTDVKIPVDYAPFRINPQEKNIRLTFYNTLAFELEKKFDTQKGKEARFTVSNTPNSIVAGYNWRAQKDKEVLSLTIDLRKSLWGFKAFYDESGQLVLRVRRPKALNPQNPLSGMRIMVDAGHPPRGATGPTGLTEADANLSIALALEKKLKERGARVIMTRRDSLPLLTDTNITMELFARVDLAVKEHADILVSVHNNGFPDGVNPFKRNGTETYYYHAFSAELARTLHKEILKATGVPSLGHKQRSLSLIRPTWMPAVLTEALYMMHPQQEAALRNPDFIDRLAEAHIKGIERFVQEKIK